jgi:hypothetical protein
MKYKYVVEVAGIVVGVFMSARKAIACCKKEEHAVTHRVPLHY